MSKLTSKERKEIPKSEFGMTKERKYPMNDRRHAANAKARATQMVEKGKLSEASKEKIDVKANLMLGKDGNGKSKETEKMRTEYKKEGKYE